MISKGELLKIQAGIIKGENVYDICETFGIKPEEIFKLINKYGIEKEDPDRYKIFSRIVRNNRNVKILMEKGVLKQNSITNIKEAIKIMFEKGLLVDEVLALANAGVKSIRITRDELTKAMSAYIKTQEDTSYKSFLRVLKNGKESEMWTKCSFGELSKNKGNLKAGFLKVSNKKPSKLFFLVNRALTFEYMKKIPDNMEDIYNISKKTMHELIEKMPDDSIFDAWGKKEIETQK